MNMDDLDMQMDNKMKTLLNRWADHGELSPERSDRLEKIVRKEARRERRLRWLRWGSGSTAAVVAFFCLLIMLFPGVRSWAADTLPVIGRYIAGWAEIEKGWQWAEEHGMFQEVLASATDNGYTLRVHRVLADPTRTTVYFTVEGDNPGSPQIHPDDVLFNGNRFVKGLSRRVEFSEGLRVGSIEFNPIPAESGQLCLLVNYIGDIKGNWHVTFPITRKPLSELTSTVMVDKKFEVPGGKLTVAELQISPVQTVLQLIYHGRPNAPDLSSQNITMMGPEGPVASRGGSGSGQLKSDGSWYQNYEIRFQRLDFEFPSQVTIKLSGLVYKEGETWIPLKGKDYALTPDGREVMLEDIVIYGQQGRATVCFTVDSQNPFPFMDSPWQVLDDAGELHQTKRTDLASSVTNMTSPLAEDEPLQERQSQQDMEWQLPPGREAVYLVNSGYWAFEEIGIVTVEIP